MLRDVQFKDETKQSTWKKFVGSRKRCNVGRFLDWLQKSDPRQINSYQPFQPFRARVSARIYIYIHRLDMLHTVDMLHIRYIFSRDCYTKSEFFKCPPTSLNNRLREKQKIN